MFVELSEGEVHVIDYPRIMFRSFFRDKCDRSTYHCRTTSTRCPCFSSLSSVCCALISLYDRVQMLDTEVGKGRNCKRYVVTQWRQDAGRIGYIESNTFASKKGRN